MTPQELRNSILQRAFTGKLVEHSYSKLNVKVIDIDENPFEIPNHWGWQVFGKICDMYTGNSIPVHVKKQKYEGLKEGYDYIGTKDVGFDQVINYNNGVRIPFETDFKIAKSGSILMCIEGGSAGRKIGVLDRDVCFGNKLCYFNSQVVLNKYIFYYLQSPLFIKEFSSNMTGIIGGVSIGKLKNIYLPIPPSEEQKRIVDKIEELMPLIDDYEKNWQRLEELNKKFPEDMKKSLLQEAIKGNLVEQRAEEGTGEELYKLIQEEKKKLIKEGKIKKQKTLDEIKEEEIPFDIPKNWKWVRLGEISTIARGGSPRPIKDYITLDDDGINWIKIGDTEKNIKYINSTMEKIKPEGLKKSRLVKPGDFLLTNSMSYGRPYILNIEGCIHDGWLVISQDIAAYNKDFLYWMLSSGYAFNQFSRRVSGAVVKNLNSDKVSESIFPLPPLAEQKRIVEKLEELLPLCDELINKEK